MRRERMWCARLLVVWCVAGCACAGGAGGSLRGALEALQRRQRARAADPARPHSLLRYRADDYDDAPPAPNHRLYDDAQAEADDERYGVDVDAVEEAIPLKYIIQLLADEEQQPSDYYEYEPKKKKSHPEREPPPPPPSAFRERSHNHNSNDDRLQEIFAERAEESESAKAEAAAARARASARLNNEAAYDSLLDELWSKYRSRRPERARAPPPEGVVKLYKERTIDKRQYPGEWGPVAFKRKRSPTEAEDEDYPGLEYPLRPDDRLKYSVDGDEQSQPQSPYGRDALSAERDGDAREEYALDFQPVDGDKIDLSSDGDEYSYDTIVKRFPVTKRSGGSYEGSPMMQRKRSAGGERHAARKFRGGSGTDPKVMRDLSEIFGEPGDETPKSPVKRSNKNEEDSHETKPPTITAAAAHDSGHDHNATHMRDVGSHEQQGHGAMHPPTLTGHEQAPAPASAPDLPPITIEKKSIDWSQYFGVDKRRKKSTPFRDDREMDHAPREHNKVKRDFIINKPIDESEFEVERASAIAIRSEQKRGDSRLDNMDRKLRGVESLIVDEALQLSAADSGAGAHFDSHEEQQLKEKMLSRLAAAYSLEKMRKALKEFKQTLHAQRDPKEKPSVQLEDSKKKRIAVKKEKAELKHDEASSSSATGTDIDRAKEEFEGEQGAGLYLDGATDPPFSDGDVGGSGRHHAPTAYLAAGVAGGECPELARMVQRCRGVDALLLAGDRDQLFLPLCTLHQICYLCGQSAPTTCDLIFLSEADTACEGEAATPVCRQAARAALMAMRELHESLVDDLDGECEASPCLAGALARHIGWSQTVKR